MPDDYMNTVNQLERHLSGDHIGSILECRNVFTANQRILDCLIEQLNNKEDVLLMCKRLSVINNAQSLTAALKDLEKGKHVISILLKCKTIIKVCTLCYTSTMADLGNKGPLEYVSAGVHGNYR